MSRRCISRATLLTCFCLAEPTSDDLWVADSQPRTNDPQLTGTITTPNHHIVNDAGDRVGVLQLQVNPELKSYHGYSGSPVTLKVAPNMVVGMLDEQLLTRLNPAAGQRNSPATNVLYAVRL